MLISQVFQPDPLSLTPGTTGVAGLILNFSCCGPGANHFSLSIMCVWRLWGCYMHLYICGYCVAYACESSGFCTRIVQSRMPGVFLHHSLCYCLETGLSLSQSWHWLANELLGSTCFCLSSARVTGICVYALLFYVGAGGLNSDPQACNANALTH